KDPPDLVVDVHERGDERFNLPPSAMPWFDEKLRKDYVLYRKPDVPWAKFYRHKSKERFDTLQRAPAGAPAEFDFEGIYQVLGRTMRDFPVLLLSHSVSNWKNVATLGLLLQAWDGLRALHSAEASFYPDHYKEL